ncbi:MAG: hypothetical protein JO227_14865 [Acetobacteraceae bacterium]|nr:hypothetical protein [Acetobacteraceae bacterium]
MPKRLARLGITTAVPGMIVASAAQAAPPEGADPALAPWFNSLRAPWTNALCCSVSDCRTADARLADDHYEAFVGGQWRAVPRDKVLQRTDNPTGRAVVCWTPTAGVVCFVPGPAA